MIFFFLRILLIINIPKKRNKTKHTQYIDIWFDLIPSDWLIDWLFDDESQCFFLSFSFRSVFFHFSVSQTHTHTYNETETNSWPIFCLCKFFNYWLLIIYGINVFLSIISHQIPSLLYLIIVYIIKKIFFFWVKKTDLNDVKKIKKNKKIIRLIGDDYNR